MIKSSIYSLSAKQSLIFYQALLLKYKKVQNTNLDNFYFNFKTLIFYCIISYK